MPRYLFLLRNEPKSAPTTTPEQRQETIRKYMAWMEKVEGGKNLIMGEKLRAGQGRVVRGHSLEVTDGPYVETKEVAGGFWLITANDYDHAIEIAKELPFGKGNLEIREIEEH